MNDTIAALKAALPPIDTDGLKKIGKEYKGPCPCCGGDDRYYVRPDNTFGCRGCHDKIGDVIEYHEWRYGTSISELKNQYLYNTQKINHKPLNGGAHKMENDPPPFRDPPPDPANNEIHMQWNQLLTHTNDKPVFDLFRRRGLSDATIPKIFAAGLARFKNHARQISVAVPYSTLQGDVLAIQYLTVDGEPYSFTVENGGPANKVMMKGSAIGKDCFFICGADINTAGIIIIAESVINALTALECFPDACCTALGGSTFTAKVAALKPYAERAEKVVVLVDNDDASEKMLKQIHGILGMTVHSFRWDATDPAGYDVNDLLMAGQRDRVIDLIQNAEQVWYKADDMPGPDADITNQWDSPMDVATALSTPPPTVKWLVENRIVHGRGLTVTALGGSSKTRFLYHLAVGAATGYLPMSWTMAKKGKAVLVLTEDTASDVHRVINRVAKDLTEYQRAELVRNLIIYPMVGKETIFLKKTSTGTLEKTQLFFDFKNKIHDLGNVAFIGLDPALSITEGDELDQNNARQLGKLVDDLAVLTDSTVALVCHASKASLNSAELSSHNSRGAGALTDAVRAELSMRNMTMDEARKANITDVEERKRIVQLVATKGNNLPPSAFVPTWLRRNDDGNLEEIELEWDNLGTLKEIDTKILKGHSDIAVNGAANYADWKRLCIESGYIKADTKEAQDKAMTRFKDKLKGLGLIIKGEKRGVWIQPYLAKDIGT